MAYSRFRLRGDLINVLDSIPAVVRPKDWSKLTTIMMKVRSLYDGFSSEPFEYLDAETKREHQELSRLFASLLRLVESTWRDAMQVFRLGLKEHRVSPMLIELRNTLREQSRGTTGIGVLLSQMASEGKLKPVK